VGGEISTATQNESKPTKETFLALASERFS